MYSILEKGTNKFMAQRKTRESANKLRDKLDNEYGSYKYYVVMNKEG